jgi:hypothetical protein
MEQILNAFKNTNGSFTSQNDPDGFPARFSLSSSTCLQIPHGDTGFWQRISLFLAAMAMASTGVRVFGMGII